MCIPLKCNHYRTRQASREQSFALKLGVGIAGYGRRGTLHAAALARVQGAEVVAVSDPIQTARERAMTDLPSVTTYGDAAEMAGSPQVNAIVVAAPAHLNGTVALQVVDSGKPILIEKPPAMSSTQLEQLMSSAHSASSNVMVAFNRRFNKLVQDAIHAVATEGRVHQIIAEFHKDIHEFTDDPRFSPDIMDYMLLESPIHAVDLALHIANSPVSSVQSVVRRAVSGYRDVHAALIEFENGTVCQFSAAYTAGGRLERYAIHGEYVSAYLEGVNTGWILRGNERHQLNANTAYLGDLIAQDAEFVNAVLQDRPWAPHAATLESSLDVLLLCEQILMATR